MTIFERAIFCFSSNMTIFGRAILCFSSNMTIFGRAFSHGIDGDEIPEVLGIDSERFAC